MARCTKGKRRTFLDLPSFLYELPFSPNCASYFFIPIKFLNKMLNGLNRADSCSVFSSRIQFSHFLKRMGNHTDK
jgi:hypothetical protein